MTLEQDLRLLLPHLSVRSQPSELSQYSRDLWPRHLIALRERPFPPKAALVVWPKSTGDVAEIIRFAEKKCVNLVPFGAGSGVIGAILPDAKTLVVDLKKINDYRVHDDGQFVTVGAGALGLSFEESLNVRGLSTGHFPSSIVCSTVGGWVAARGAGQCSGRYGKIEDMVAELEVITGKGELCEAKYRRQGPNLLPLLIGSEGTLGVITRATLRVHPVPQKRGFLAFDFGRLEQGIAALQSLFQRGLRPAVTRLYDPLDSVLFLRSSKPASSAEPNKLISSLKQRAIHQGLKLSRLGFGALEKLEALDLVSSLLILVFEGPAEVVDDEVDRARTYCVAAHGRERSSGLAERWFRDRYNVSFKQSGVFASGSFSDTFEVAAPWSKLLDVYHRVRRAIAQEALVLSHLSHAYPDGCSIYFTFAASAKSPGQSLAKYDDIWRRALQAALDAGATISHHHGLGRSKREFLMGEWGEPGVLLQRAIRRAFDPHGLLNPGNLEPSSSSLAAGFKTEPRGGDLGHDVPAEGLMLDEPSLTLWAKGSVTLGQAERFARARGCRLQVGNCAKDLSIASWVAMGLPQGIDSWLDPTSQPLSGLDARLASGKLVRIKSVPRRATGPDLRALFVGAGTRVGEVERAALSVVPLESLPVHGFQTSLDRDPAVSASEGRIWERVVEETGQV